MAAIIFCVNMHRHRQNKHQIDVTTATKTLLCHDITDVYIQIGDSKQWQKTDDKFIFYWNHFQVNQTDSNGVSALHRAIFRGFHYNYSLFLNYEIQMNSISTEIARQQGTKRRLNCWLRKGQMSMLRINGKWHHYIMLPSWTLLKAPMMTGLKTIV